MDTIIKKIDEDNIDEDILRQASDIIRSGGLVVFPTETVYGLGADGLLAEGSMKIYAAKGRPSDNPLILHIAELDALKDITKDIPETAYALADRFWPGPLTMIFNKSDKVPYETSGGLETVAVRMPSNKIAWELIKASGTAIAAPSANTSGKPSPTRVEHVIDDLYGKVDMIIDGGESAGDIGLESTIVDLTSEIPTILRPGYITKDMLEEVIGEVDVDRALLKKGEKPKAPGMKYRHYAPKGQLTIVDGQMDNVVSKINELADEKERQGYRVGIIATEETKDLYKYGTVKCIGSRESEDTIGRNLYAVLRDFDALESQYIYSEAFPYDGYGQAIMNRLVKAAGHTIIKL